MNHSRLMAFLRRRRRSIVIAFLAAVIFSPLGLDGCWSAARAWTLFRHPEPDAFLILGGYMARVEGAVRMPDVRASAAPIYYSSGTPGHIPLFEDAGISADRVIVDTRARDTLTNFTTLVDEFRRRRFRHIRIITCAGHLRRARAIARVVLGSAGIACSTAPVSPGVIRSEPMGEAVRDYLRAWVWLATGWTGRRLPRASHR